MVVYSSTVSTKVPKPPSSAPRSGAQRAVEAARVAVAHAGEAALEVAADEGLFFGVRLDVAAARQQARASIGTRVSDTSADTSTARPTMTANSWNSRPITPGMKKIGMNTATSEIEIEMMVKPISREPTSAAWKGFLPISMWRTMFSSTTMASSTTRPTASVMPSSEILSRL
jgi:hypothetical protein